MKSLLKLIRGCSLAILAASVCFPVRAQLLSGYILPSSTDPAITTFNAGHYVVIATNPAIRLNKLLVHLPGTGHDPAQATNFVRTAAALGYHALSLKYVNLPSLAAECTVNPDLDCYRRVIEEKITGNVWTNNDPNAIEQVTPTDSITNRLVKLLNFLSTNSLTAADNWAQFLGPDGVQWSNVTVSGHSQGSSCALLLAKLHEVERAILFSTVDWIYYPTNDRPAWFAEAGLTPPEGIYGFTHFNDFGGGHTQQPLIWQDLHIRDFGPILHVESNAPPYSGSHTLTTLLEPASPGESYHASVIVDAAVPTNSNGGLAWLPVWNYMLTNISAPLPASLTLNTNSSGLWQVNWLGNSGFSSQLERSPNLLSWFPVTLPAPETNTFLSLPIPLAYLGESDQYFRLLRRPLVTTPIPTAPGLYLNQSFVHGGRARNYYLQVPAGWNAATNWPLVLALPGHGQSIASFAAIQSEFVSLANTNGVILVFAEATAGDDSYKWFAYPDPQLTQPYIDDAAFLLALINDLKASGLNVDTNRCYLVGFSNGGSMTHYLASLTNHPFAAFAIMESGSAPVANFREPYDPWQLEQGSLVAANVQLPWTPRPVMLMNMATSVPWPFEGRFPNRGARENVSRWVQANGFGLPQTNATLGIIEPPAALIQQSTNWTATGTDRAREAIADMRPDHNWPLALLTGTNGWTVNLAAKFQYTNEFGINQRLPEWVRTAYPHTISPDPFTPDYARVDAGTMTVEIWRSAPLNRTNEVIFIGLSDGGHQWPNAADKLPFNGSVEVLKFFNAH